MKPDLTASQLADIILRLNGNVDPIGDSAVDGRRYDDLVRLLGALDALLSEIYFVSKNADHYEFSRKIAGETAVDWLKDKKEWIEEVLNEREVRDDK